MICELSSLFSILWPLNQACALYSPTQTQTRVEKALPATKRGPQLNSLAADLGYSVTLAPRIHPHPSRQASEALALTCQGLRGAPASVPHPATPPARGPPAGGFGKGPPGPLLALGDPRPAPGLLRLRPAQCRPLPGPAGVTASPGSSRPAGSGGLCPAPALASLAASRQAPCCWEPTRNQPLNMSEGRCLGGGRTPGTGARPGNGHPGRAVGPSVVPTLRTSVPKLPSRGIPALLQPCPQDPNPGASRAELRPRPGSGGLPRSSFNIPCLLRGCLCILVLCRTR